MSITQPLSPNNSVRLFLLTSLLLIFSLNLTASESDLLETYEELEDKILENRYDIPMYLESNVTDNSMRGDVYAIIYQPYKLVLKNLTSFTNWCQIMPQHLNIKACTYQYINKQCRLTFYSGRKFYEKADDVYQLDYHFKITAANENYLNLTLTLNEGPLDTTDYIIKVAAIPISDSSTFFHFSYAYKFGFWTSFAMSTYFSTIGSDKVGFTVKHTDTKGNPVYVDGVLGVIERNSIRYLFAIQSYLGTLEGSDETRFYRRSSRWFDLTERFHRQLYEMDKTDYLKFKTMEYQDQLRLQDEINKKPPEHFPGLATACLTIN